MTAVGLVVVAATAPVLILGVVILERLERHLLGPADQAEPAAHLLPTGELSR